MLLKDFLKVIKNNPTIYILSIENERLYKDLIDNNVDISEVYNVLPYLGDNLVKIESAVNYDTPKIYQARVKQVLVLCNTMYIFIGLSHSEFFMSNNELKRIVQGLEQIN